MEFNDIIAAQIPEGSKCKSSLSLLSLSKALEMKREVLMNRMHRWNYMILIISIFTLVSQIINNRSLDVLCWF